VTKKVGGAVIRNRIRRRCKSVLDDLLQGDRGRWFVIACAPLASKLRYAELRSQLTSAIARCANRKGRSR
jgi:ribonuclease P protein component